MNTNVKTFRDRIDNHSLPKPGKNETVNDAVRAISFRAMLETLSGIITETPINAPDSLKAQNLERARNYISTWQ